MDWDLNYGESAKDEEFVKYFEEMKGNLQDIQKTLDDLLPFQENYDNLTLPAQIELDLFLTFTLNSLHWVYLQIQGIDPTTHPIKDELQRIKAVMKKWQQVQDKENRPTVDIEAAKRFIRSGLYDPYKGTGKNKITKIED